MLGQAVNDMLCKLSKHLILIFVAHSELYIHSLQTISKLPSVTAEPWCYCFTIPPRSQLSKSKLEIRPRPERFEVLIASSRTVSSHESKPSSFQSESLRSTIMRLRRFYVLASCIFTGSARSGSYLLEINFSQTQATPKEFWPEGCQSVGCQFVELLHQDPKGPSSIQSPKIWVHALQVEASEPCSTSPPQGRTPNSAPLHVQKFGEARCKTNGTEEASEREQLCDMFPAWDYPQGISSSNEIFRKYRIPKNSTTIIVQRISFEKESPHGDLKQETYRKHPVLQWL